jgi:uncharacterized membrane protein
METSLNLVTIISIGLLIGTEFAVSAFVNPVLAQLGDKSEAHATRLFAKRLGAFMPFWYGLGLLLLAAQGVAARHQAGFVWIVTAAALWVAVIAFSIVVLVPINNRIAAMSAETFESSLRTQHARWDTLHRGRVAVLLVAMVCLLMGTRI